MLESARRLTLPPASNLRNDVDSTWFHLLPSLELGTVVCIGIPSATVTRLIERHAARVVVFGPETPEELPDCDLLVVACGPDSELESTIRALVPLIGSATTVALLPPPGARHRWGWRGCRSAADILGKTLQPSGRWFLIPSRREGSRTSKRMRRARRLLTARIGRHLGRRSLGAAHHASDLVVHRPILINGVPRSGNGALLGSAMSLSRLPQYLLDLGAAHGFDFGAARWSFGPARGFRSQKIVFIVDKSSDDGELIIKSTQEARFNERLAAEVAALEMLQNAGDLPELTVPEIRFAAEHSGLLLVAETKLTGAPYRWVARPDPNGIHFDAGIDALIALAATTRRTVTPRELGDAMDTLVKSFCDTFSPPRSVAEALTEAADRLATKSVPAVLQHGDFGVWNLLAPADGAPIGILDWENADASGVPLWDLFVFARTFGVFMADSAGVRYSPAVFRRQLLEPSPLLKALEQATNRFCTELSIDEAAVSDLFTLCWVQQAIREAATLPKPSWEEGRNNRYVEACLHTPLRLGI